MRIDGHDIPLLEDTFERAKSYDEPVVVHVVTEKGNGYQPAIDDVVDKLHGVGKFDLATGLPLSSELKLTDVIGKAVLEVARREPELVGISAAMISSTGLTDMAEEFPDRVIDTGIAEQHAVGLAAGLAMAGKRPVVAIYSSFLQRAIDQITMDVALHQLPVIFLIDRAGVTGPDGPSHHGVFDLTFLRMIPDLVVGAPADAAELAGMLESAVTTRRPDRHPLPEGLGGVAPGASCRSDSDRRVGGADHRGGCALLRQWTNGRARPEGRRHARAIRHLMRCGQRTVGEAARRAALDLGERLQTRRVRRGQRGPRWIRVRRDGGARGYGTCRQGAPHGCARSLPSGRLGDDVIRSIGLEPDQIADRVALLLRG